MMQIQNGRFQGVPFKKAVSYSTAAIKPLGIIFHDTAGRLDKGNCVSWFQNKSCKVSAHLVVERDGSITQMVPFDQKAYHAGASEWNGTKWCNSRYIGVEIVNPGKLDASGKAWFGVTYSNAKKVSSPDHGGEGYWLDYTSEQIEACKAIARSLYAHYASCNECLTHWLVSPGRKVDTSPLFPLDDVRAFADGTAGAEEEEPPASAKPSVSVKDVAVAAGGTVAGGTAGGVATGAIPVPAAPAAPDLTWFLSWQSFGMAVSGLGKWATGNPVLVGGVGLVIAAVWVGPWAWSKIKGHMSNETSSG